MNGIVQKSNINLVKFDFSSETDRKPELKAKIIVKMESPSIVLVEHFAYSMRQGKSPLGTTRISKWLNINATEMPKANELRNRKF